MSGDGFQPLNKEHAIDQVILQVEFASELNDTDFSPAMWTERAKRLAPHLPAFATQQGLRVVQEDGTQRVRTGIVAAEFSRMRPDGVPAQQLRLERNTLGLTITRYSRWDAALSLATTVMKDVVIEDCLGKGLEIASVSVHYLDRFVWRGDDSLLNHAQLLKDESPWLTPKSRDSGKYWHVHSGLFIPVDKKIRRLAQVNIAAASMDAVEDGRSLERPVVNIDINLVDAINQKDYEPHNFADSAAAFTWITERFQQLHNQNKVIMSQILSDEAQQGISLFPSTAHAG